MTGFLAGVLVGGLLFWTLATAAEKVRRARSDWRHALKQLKTSRKLFWAAVRYLGRVAVIPILAVAVLVAVMIAKGTP